MVLMVQQHLGFWLTSAHKVQTGLLPLVVGLNSLGGAAAPLFVFLSGVGVSLGKRLTNAALVRRAFALVVCAYLLNLACPSWLSPGSFYVLHLIASFWLLAPFLRNAGDRWLLGLALVLLLLTVVVQTALGTPPYLSSARLQNTSLPGGALRLALAEGHFPLLPWLSFAVLGIWAGRRLPTGQTSRLYVLAGVLLGAYLLLRLPRFALPVRELRRLPWRSVVDFTFYPASVAFVLGLAGVCVVLLAWVSRKNGADASSQTNAPSSIEQPAKGVAAERPAKGVAAEQPAKGVAAWLVELGRTSLTLLVAHVVVFRQGSTALGLYQRVAPGVTLLVIALVLVGWAVLARAWGRAGYRYSLEWWLRRAGDGARAQDLPR